MRANALPDFRPQRWLIALSLALQAGNAAWADGAGAGDPVRFPPAEWIIGPALLVAIAAAAIAGWHRVRTRREVMRQRREALDSFGRRIRNSLNGIVGTVQLLLDSPLDQEQREHVRSLRDSADEMTKIVGEMTAAAEPGVAGVGSAGKSTQRELGSGPGAAAHCAVPAQRPHYGRILVAEDNAVNQRVVVLLLKRLGYSCDAVADGSAAVAALRDKTYDLVLMDCQMPEMDGCTATRMIRDPATGVLDPAIPIVALTANALAGDREQALQAGMNDYLLKPLDFEQFESTVQRWLNASAGTAPVATDSSGSKQTPPAPARTAPLPVFDRDAALRRLLSDPALLRVVIDALLDDLPRQTAALDAARQAGDATTLSRYAHSIKGAAANVGAEALRGVARELEHAAGAGDWQRIRVLRPVLDLEIERFRSEAKQTVA
jgi:CheY-like chemotaxis protein/HPt (histidine-containing phosphotransfer) domain-containing protein